MNAGADAAEAERLEQELGAMEAAELATALSLEPGAVVSTPRVDTAKHFILSPSPPPPASPPPSPSQPAATPAATPAASPAASPGSSPAKTPVGVLP